MLRKFFVAILFALSSFGFTAGGFAATDVIANQIETQYSTTEHYFRIEYINGHKYLCEYDEDGSLVNITELYD